MSGSRLVNRNITARVGRTSMRLEPELWDALDEICLRERMSLREIVQHVEGAVEESGRTSALRVYILTYFRNAATEAGHAAAGHGPLVRAEDTAEAKDDGAPAAPGDIAATRRSARSTRPPLPAAA